MSTLWVQQKMCTVEPIKYNITNHYHLVIRTPQGNLVFGMQWLQSTWLR